MANMLQSAQTQATQAPDYYNTYLSGLATAGQQAQKAAEYVGAQPLQTKAFEQACQRFGAQQPAFQTGQAFVGQAAGQDITGAASPYLRAATGSSPLAAMQPYAQEAMCYSGYCAAIPLVGQGAGLSGLTAASPFLGRAAGAGGACASSRYVNMATGLSAPCAASPYLRAAATNDPSQMAAAYMSPYKQGAMQSMSDIAMRNIRQNLSPMATAAAVGSGQFGSQRGAQVLGQIQEQAMQDLNAQMAQMLNTGYGQALQAAGQQQSLLGQLGQTAGGLTTQQMQNLIQAGNVQGTLTQQQQNLLGQLGQTAGGLTNQQAQNLINAGLGLGQQQTAANQIAAGLGSTAAQAQQAQNQANLTAAATAGCAAAKQALALTQAGQSMGTLGQQAAAANLACINALATLGGQQQTIAQNRQLFPLTTLASLAGLLQGYQMPTTTKTTLCMSPFSALGAVGAGTMGLLQGSGAGGTGPSPLDSLINTYKKYFGSSPAGTTPTDNNNDPYPKETLPQPEDVRPESPTLNVDENTDLYPPVQSEMEKWPLITCCASGGLVQGHADGGEVGCMYSMNMGAMPGGFCQPACMTCIPRPPVGGLAGLSSLGQAIGCASTQNRGALPNKG